MAFLKLMCKASKIDRIKQDLVLEKENSIEASKGIKPKYTLRQKYKHIWVDLDLGFKHCLKKICSCVEDTFIHRTCYNLRHEGTCENFTLKSVAGFIGGFLLTYVFYMFFVFQLNFKLSTATIMCSIVGSILTIGLAFSYKVRCVVFLLLPQFFSKRGRQALLAYAFILAITGPAKNTLNNMGILSESMACGQEQLKQAVKQILEVIKKPFYAIKDAIKTVVKTVKVIVKKIKEILLTIKRIVMAIVRVIKAAFQFLGKILNICNKELGTPFERCSRVFENAISDCNAKLGPLFNWLCSIAYLVKTVCYLVKVFDFVCMLIDFIKGSVVGVVIRKIKTFVRHVRTMFYVRIRFSHSFHFETTQSKSITEITEGIVTEVRHRTEGVLAVFDLMSCATSLFFLFIIFRVVRYRYKFLTSERFDNKYITKDFRFIDMRRAKLEKETVLPLNHLERRTYVPTGSLRLVQSERRNLSKSMVILSMATLKLCTHMMADYALYWVLNKIRYHARFQSSVRAPNIPGLNVQGTGLLADLLRSIVNAFQPIGVQLEIDTIPCLPDPIPPDFDRYLQIGTLLILCWFLTVFEPYGLRLRHKVMCYYHPTRAKQRAVWLYNHILRSRSSFLKFARRQLKRKVMGSKDVTKITCMEYLRANIRPSWLRYCLGKDKQEACLLCGEVFRESDGKKPIHCQTPGCLGVYCEQCFTDLQNLCTICLDPIEYGDLSDISEEKDSSGDEREPLKKKKKRKCRISKCCKKKDDSDDDTDSDNGKKLLSSKLSSEDEREHPKKKKKKRKCRISKCCKNKDDSDDETDSDDGKKLLPSKSLKEGEEDDNKQRNKIMQTDSDYYSSGNETDYSYSYQNEKDITTPSSQPSQRSFVDIEKQHYPDYASMESFREMEHEIETPTVSGSRKKLVVTCYDSSSSEVTTQYREEMPKPIKRKFIRRIRFIGFSRSKSGENQTTSKDSFELAAAKEETPLLSSNEYFISTDEEKEQTMSPTVDTDSSIDSEIREKQAANVPKLDLSSLETESEPTVIYSKPGAEQRFKNIKHEIVKETPTSTSRSTQTGRRSVESGDYILEVPVCRRYSARSTETLDNISRRKLPAKSSLASKPSAISKPAKRHNALRKKKHRKQPNKFVKFIRKLFRKKKTKKSPSTAAVDVGVLFESKGKRPPLASKSFVNASAEDSSTPSSGSPGAQGYVNSKTSTETSDASLMGGAPRKQSQEGEIFDSDPPRAETDRTLSSKEYPLNPFESSDSLLSELRGQPFEDYKEPEEVDPEPSLHVIYSEASSPLRQYPVQASPAKSTQTETDYQSNSSDQMSVGDGASTETIVPTQRYSREPPERDENSQTQMRNYSQQPIHHQNYYKHDNYSPGDFHNPVSKETSTISTNSARNIMGTPPRRNNSEEQPVAEGSYHNAVGKEGYFTSRTSPIGRHRGSTESGSFREPPLPESDNLPSDDDHYDRNLTYIRSSPTNHSNKILQSQSNSRRSSAQSHSAPEVLRSREPSYNNYVAPRVSDEIEIERTSPRKQLSRESQRSRDNKRRSRSGSHHLERYRVRSKSPPRRPYNPCYENCSCCHCNGYESRSDNYLVDDDLSSYSESSKNTNVMDLAYQHNDEYLELVQELEDTLSQRNKERVRRTMREFEIMSRQNRNLEKPIFDDEEPIEMPKPSKLHRHKHGHRGQQRSNPCYCNNQEVHYHEMAPDMDQRHRREYHPERDAREHYDHKNPANGGHVENVVRNMDPNPSVPEQSRKYPRFKRSQCSTRWQMDQRTGEWYKVYDEYEQRASHSARCMCEGGRADDYPKHLKHHGRRSRPERCYKCNYPS